MRLITIKEIHLYVIKGQLVNVQQWSPRLQTLPKRDYNLEEDPETFESGYLLMINWLTPSERSSRTIVGLNNSFDFSNHLRYFSKIQVKMYF
jgi:hypothetical protein